MAWLLSWLAAATILSDCPLAQLMALLESVTALLPAAMALDVSCAREVEALPARLRHLAERCH